MMFKKLIFGIAMIAGVSATAQTNNWTYDFGTSEAIFNPEEGGSSTKFMPKPGANPDKSIKQVVRIRTGSGGAGAVALTKKGASFFEGAGLEILAGITTSKFAIYNFQGTAVLKNSFHIKFGDSKDVQWIYANGNSVDKEDVFAGNSNIKETSSEIFAGLRWKLSDADDIAFAYRNGTKWSTVKGTSFAKNTDYLVEVYSNNSKEDKTYSKEGNQTLKAGMYQVWVNGKKLTMDFPNSSLDAGKTLNAFIIYGYKPKDSTEKPYAWMDSVNYADNL